MSIEVDEFYKKEAKDLINVLFDKNFLNPELTRESIDWLEDYMGFCFQCRVDMAVRADQLLARLKGDSHE
jgi:hypothetical protein